jgi:hypothetical protein
MNRCEVDGKVYEARPVAWPLHERPRDQEAACAGCAGLYPLAGGSICHKLPSCYGRSCADGQEIIWVEANATADLPAVAGKVRRDVGQEQEVDRG